MAGHGATDDGRRVTLFSAYYLSHGGGMELACAELAHALGAAGMAVEWVSQADGPQQPCVGVTYTPVTGTDAVYRLTGVPAPLPMPWAIPTLLCAARRARLVVVAEANFALCVLGFMAAKLCRRPVMLVQHVGAPSTVSRLARVVMRVGEAVATRPMVRSADAVVCVSPVVAGYFAAVRRRSNLVTIGHGVDTAAFRPPTSPEERQQDRAALRLPPDGRIACFVGRMTDSKGIGVIAQLARLRPDWTFVTAGTGPIDPAAWGLPNVITLGQIDHATVARLYRASAAMVLPSQSESFSLVVREALASGAGVVCSDQILETDPGLLPFIVTEPVDLSDVTGTATRFAAALDRLSGEPDAAARDYVMAQCSRNAVNARYVELAEALLARGGR